MNKNIKFKSIEDFVNYPHDEIISSKGFSEHDKEEPQIDHKEAFREEAIKILEKEVAEYKSILDSGASETPEIDKTIYEHLTKTLNSLSSDDWSMDDLSDSVNYSSDLYSAVLDEEVRIQAEENNSNYENGDEYNRTSHLVTKIGEDTYELSITESRDIEGTSYHEEWKRNDQLHRYGGGPAETKRELHNIPEEKYMDEHYESFCINGKEIKRTDCLSEHEQREVDIHSKLGLGSSKQELEEFNF